MSARRIPASLARYLANVAFLCLLLNLVILVVTPIARRDLDVLHRSLSYYAVGPWAMLQNLAFASMGVASFVLGVILIWGALATGWQRACGVALLIAACGSIGLVAFPIDAKGPSTFLGDTHQTAGTIGGVAQLLATLSLAIVTRTDPRWSRLAAPAAIALSLACLGAISTQASIWWTDLGIPRGISMRLFVVPLAVFWSLVALHLRDSLKSG